MKKSLSILLVLLLFLTTFNVALAEPAIEDEKVNQALPKSHELLHRIGILEESDLALPANEILTRGEFAMYLCRFVNLDTSLIPYDPTAFYDVFPGTKEENSIYTAVNGGLMKPVKKNYFYPAYQITRKDAVYGILMSLGYETMLQQIPHPEQISGANALFKGVLGSGDLKRIDVYKMLYNALFMPVMKLDSVGSSGVSYQVDNNKDALLHFHQIDVISGIIMAVGKTELGKPDGRLPQNTIKIENTYFKTTGNLPVNDWLGRNVKNYFNTSDPTSLFSVYLEDNGNDVVRFEDTEDLTYSTTEYTFSGGSRKYAFSKPYVIYNGSEYVGAYDDEIMCPPYGQVSLLDNNRDGVYDFIFVTAFKDYFIQYADAENGLIADYLIPGFNFDPAEGIEIYNEGGRLDSFTSLTDKSVITVIPDSNRNFYKVHVSKETIEGTITEIQINSGHELWKIQDREYSLAPYLENAIENSLLQYPLIGENYIFYLNIYKKIVYFERPSSGFVKDRNYGVITGGSRGSSSLSEDISLRIFSKATGGFENYKVAERIRLNKQGGVKQKEVYSALTRDGMFGVPTDSIVPQVIEFSVDDEGTINYIQQVGAEDPNNPMLHLFSKTQESAMGFSLPYRDILACYNDEGRSIYNSRAADIVGVSFTGTDCLRIPFRDGKIATDREDLFLISAIPSNVNLHYNVYKINPRSLMADFVMIREDANAAINCGNLITPAQVQRISQVIRDDVPTIQLKTERKDYFIDTNKFDISKLKIYDNAGNDTGLTYALKVGDIINILADTRDNITAIEPLYDFENNKFVNFDGTLFYQRSNQWRAEILKLYKYEGLHWQLTSEDIGTFDEVYSYSYLSKVRPETYYFDRINKTIVKATREHFVGFKESLADYVIVVQVSSYNNPKFAYVMKNPDWKGK